MMFEKWERQKVQGNRNGMNTTLAIMLGEYISPVGQGKI